MERDAVRDRYTLQTPDKALSSDAETVDSTWVSVVTSLSDMPWISALDSAVHGIKQGFFIQLDIGLP